MRGACSLVLVAHIMQEGEVYVHLLPESTDPALFIRQTSTQQGRQIHRHVLQQIENPATIRKRRQRSNPAKKKREQARQNALRRQRRQEETESERRTRREKRNEEYQRKKRCSIPRLTSSSRMVRQDEVRYTYTGGARMSK